MKEGKKITEPSAENLKAWAHWAKLNPVDEDQFSMAVAIENLFSDRDAFREAWHACCIRTRRTAKERDDYRDALKPLRERYEKAVILKASEGAIMVDIAHLRAADSALWKWETK